MTNQQYKILINTLLDRDATSNSMSDFRVYLKRPISTNQSNFTLGVRKVSIPNTAYPFHSTESKLYYLYDLNGVNTMNTVSISSTRKYDDMTELVNELNSGFTSNGHNIVATVNSNSKKLSITNNEALKIRIVGSYLHEGDSVNGTTLNDQANSKLGLTQDLTSEGILIQGQVVEGASIVRLVYTQVYHLVSNELGDNDLVSTPSPFDNPRILCSILNDKSWGDIITKEFIDEDMLTFEFSNSVSQFDITLVDDQLRTVDTQGSPLIIELEYQYIKR